MVVIYSRTILGCTSGLQLPIVAYISLHLFTSQVYSSPHIDLWVRHSGCLLWSLFRPQQLQGWFMVRNKHSKEKIRDVLRSCEDSKTQIKLQAHKHKPSTCSTASVFSSGCSSAVVIISDIRAQPVVCVVSRPHRSAEFSRLGRGCLWERADKSHNQVIALPGFTNT